MGQKHKSKAHEPRAEQTTTELDAVRHSLLAQQFPMLYLMMLIASALVLFVFRNSAPTSLISITPGILMTAAGCRMLHWARQRNATLTLAQIKRELKVTTFLGPTVAFAFTVWASVLFDYGDATQQAFLVLMVLICATMTAVCTAVMSLVSSMVIVAACVPFIVKLMMTGNDTLITMIIAFATIGTLLHQMLRRYSGAFTDIIENRALLAQRNQQLTAAKHQISQIAYLDQLTDIANKRRFAIQLERQIKRHRKINKPFMIGIVDVDGFATINDVFGHAYGDEVLKQVAIRLQQIVGQVGFVARVDGDEFAFILDKIDNNETAKRFAKRVCDELEKHYHIDGRTAILSASCGLAAYPQSADKADLLTSRAYCALNEAKASERTGISLFDPAHENTIHHRSQVEQALRRALHNQDLEVVYQPIVDLTTLRPVAFEALARWKDQDLGEVSPDVFVPIAEQTGLINELTFQLLDEASAAANQWPKDVHLSFNMSAKEVVKTSTGLRTLSVLNKNMLPPQRLDIEITESAFIENLEAAIANIQNLKLSGISVALDDFGTGHASLGYVEKIALDKLKIDRSFITSINEKERSQYIVKAIIEMCRNLEIRCIAEGIETHDELSALRALGCKYGQGFLFARPMTEDQTLQYLAAEKFAIPLNQRRLVG